MSSYFDTLDRQGKDRYQRKPEVVGLSLKDDPFTAGTSEKWHSDMVNWPKIEYGHIFSYFISRPGTYTQEQLLSSKRLEAYNYFQNGYTRTVFVFSVWHHGKSGAAPAILECSGQKGVWLGVWPRCATIVHIQISDQILPKT